MRETERRLIELTGVRNYLHDRIVEIVSELAAEGLVTDVVSYGYSVSYTRVAGPASDAGRWIAEILKEAK